MSDRIDGQSAQAGGQDSVKDIRMMGCFKELIYQRRSIRKFKNTPVDDATLDYIFEIINRAPSAGNLQSYELYVVRDDDQRKALAGVSRDQEFVAEAPLVLVFCANASTSGGEYGERGETLYCLQDATVAITYALLAATAQGLATVWIGAFDEKGVTEALGLPKEHRPVAMLPIGYGGEMPALRERRDVKELVKYL